MGSEASTEMVFAKLWQAILRVDHATVFENAATAVIDREHGYDRLPQPGLVGSNYRPGGILILGQNPGNDSVGKGLSHSDLQQYELLIRLRNAENEEDLRTAYVDLMKALRSIVMPNWKIVKNVANPLLAALGLDLNDVAYTNLVKFRTANSSFGKSPYEASWPATSKQIEVLQPTVIIALGYTTRKQFTRLYKGSIPVYAVCRQIGDSALPEVGRRDIATIAGELHAMKVRA